MFADVRFRWTDPSTWPWMVYVWLAFLLAGWSVSAWRWLQRNRAAGWPVAEARIESVEITKPSFSFTTTRGYWVAELGYSYSVAGLRHSGRCRREFPTESEAQEFIRGLKDKPVAVHCNSTNPSSSVLLEPDIVVLQQNRAPAPPLDFSPADAVPGWMRPFLWFFVCFSAIGLILSLWVHVGAVMGRRVAPEAFFWGLHVGIFVVWIPAVLIGQRLAGNVNRKDLWKVVLKDSSGWMRYMLYGFFGYAVINFLFFMTQAPSGSSGANPPAVVWRGFSGHWMAFYSAALALLYAAARTEDTSLRCSNGHLASSNAVYCTRFGHPVQRVR